MFGFSLKVPQSGVVVELFLCDATGEFHEV